MNVHVYLYCTCRWAKPTVSTDILHNLFPGPVTAVFERRETLNKSLNPGVTLIGIRIPDHLFIRKLAKACGHPLALTSANLSNDKNTLEVEVSVHVHVQTCRSHQPCSQALKRTRACIHTNTHT